MKKTGKSKADKPKKADKARKPKKKSNTAKPSEKFSTPEKTGLPAIIPPKVGRPSKYRDHFPEEARKLCLLLNATDEDLADYFEVDRDTIYAWKNEHPEFSDSIRAGKVKADSSVAASLHERAVGYSYYEEVPIKVKREWYDTSGKKCSEESVEVTKVLRVVPPDVRAQEIYLRNRQSKRWNKGAGEPEDPKAPLAPGNVNLQINGQDVRVLLQQVRQDINDEF